MKSIKLFLSGVAVFLISFSAFAHGIAEADKDMAITGGLLQYIWLGAIHMVTGYDHLLFIFGVIFFLSKFKDVVKFITAFTLGHSITLVAATYMGITANYYIVDAIIALTVVYKGFDNIDGFKKYLKVKAPNILALIFVFGLIHGFGLSTRLQELPLPHDGLFLKIISFNVGVEVGQIAALTVMMLALSSWRKTTSFQRFSRATNIGLILAGLFLFGMQVGKYFKGEVHHHVQQEVYEHVPYNTGDPLVGAGDDLEAPKSEPKPHSHGHSEPHSHE